MPCDPPLQRKTQQLETTRAEKRLWSLSLPLHPALSRYDLNLLVERAELLPPASSLASPQRSWLARGLRSNTLRLSQAGTSSWLLFGGVWCNLDVGQPGLVAVL